MKKVCYILCTLFFSLLFLFIFKSGVYAASATITASSTNIKKGESVTISAKINSAASWNLNASASGGSLTKADDRVGTTNSGNNESTTVKLGTFTSNTVGEYTITLSGTVLDGNSLTKTNASGSVKIKVTEPTTSNNNNSSSSNKTSSNKSSDATLKSLNVKGASLNKKFSSGTTKYSVSVANNIESVTVNATANSSKAKVSITGNKNLKVGGNTVNITVTAEDGTKKVYKINVSRQADEGAVQSNPEEEPVEEVKLLLKSLEIEGYKFTPEFSPEVYEYSLTIPEEDYDVEKLDIKAIGNEENFIVEITGNEELVDGENIITITVKSPDTADVVTYKIIVTKEAKVVEAIANVIEEDEEVEEEPQISMLAIGVIIFTAVVAIAGIIFAVVEYKYGKNKKEEDDGFGAIPYSNLGFHTEDEETKVENTIKNDVKEESENVIKENNQEIENEDIKNFIEEKIKTEEIHSDNLIEELYNKKTESQIIQDSEDDNKPKRGRHF